MAIKYNRGNEPISLENVSDRWGGPTRNPKWLRRRLLYINVGVLMVTILLFFYVIMTSKKTERWLPVRPGDGEIVAKTTEGENFARHFFVEISIEVPPAEPSEAEFVTEDTPDRDTVVGALTLSHEAQVSEDAWNVLEVGQRVNVMYQIDLMRAQVFVSEVRPRE